MEQRKEKILIVDDEPANINLLVEALQDDNYTFIIATNGPKAIECAEADDLPDLILLDIIMPDMDGFEVCGKLKANEKTGCIPIIFITAMGEQTNECQGFLLGAVDYITKPFNPSTVRARVRTHLDLKRHRDFLEDILRERTEKLETSNELLRGEIHERRRVEEQFATAMTHNPIATIVVSKNGDIISFNRIAEEVTGYRSNEVRTFKNLVNNLFSEADEPDFDCESGEKLHRVITCKDGETRWVHFHVSPFAGGKVIRMLDVTEQFRTEQALRESEERHRLITENSYDLIAEIDSDGAFRYTNSRYGEVLGFDGHELVGRNIFEYIHPDDVAEVRNRFEQIIQSPGNLHNTAYRFRDRSGKWRWFETAGRTYLKSDKIFMVTASRDITDRKKSEKELRRLATAIEQAMDIVMITDTNTIIQYVNPAFERITGYNREEVAGQNFFFIAGREHNKPTVPLIQGRLKKGMLWSGCIVNTKKGGELFEVEATISPIRDESSDLIGYVSVQRDVTREIRLQKQLRQAWKMEAVGTLAGGIAHDFNNILGALLGYADMAFELAEEDSPSRRYLDQVLIATRRAKDLVKQILAFSRSDEQEKSALRVSVIIKEVLNLLRSTIPSTIEIRRNIGDVSATVMANPTQIHQIVMNLCANAVYAMRNGGGILAVALNEITVEENEINNLKPGSYVRLSVGDTGHGMDRTTMDRIFEPFFTTKPVGEGTGMGLSVVHGTVMGMGGDLTVESVKNTGSTFHVLLPRIEDGIRAESEVQSTISGGTERVLFVDDEESLAKLGKDILESLGYKATSISDSIEAFRVFNSKPDAFDLVITDQIMPDMIGTQLAEKILSVRKDIPIILCTGFSEGVSLEKLESIGITDFLMKPMTKKEIADSIRKSLDSKKQK